MSSPDRQLCMMKKEEFALKLMKSVDYGTMSPQSLDISAEKAGGRRTQSTEQLLESPE